MNDEAALRLSRQISLPAIGRAGQERLQQCRALIVGLGGLGAPAALYLANGGIGHLAINDFDRVDASNLPRQILFDTDSVGRFKTEATATQLKRRNPDVELTELNTRLGDDEMAQHVTQADVVLDCTDNFSTRFLINRLCVAHRKPLVSGAAIRFEGQLAVFRHDRHIGPCYSCLYDEADDNLESCAGQGILGPVAGMIGSMMATEAIKVLLDLPTDLEGKLWVYDGANSTSRTLAISRRGDCAVCS